MKHNMEELEEIIVPALRLELRRKPDGAMADAAALKKCSATAALLLTDYLNRLKSELVEMQDEADRQARLVAQCELGLDVRAELEAYRGSGRDTGKNDPGAESTEYLYCAQPEKPLRSSTRMAKAGMLFFGIADLLAVGLAMRHRSLDALGNFNGSPFALVAVSLVTLFLYFLTGLIWRHSRAGAAGVYAFTVGLLMLVLLPDESAHARELWDSLHPSANIFAADGAAPAAAPSLFVYGYVGMWALAYTVSGLLFIASKLRYADCREQWKKRASPEAKLSQVENAAHSAADGERVADRIVSLESNEAATISYFVRRAHDLEMAAETARRDELLNKATRLTTSTASKALFRAEAENIGAWLKGSALVEANDSDKQPPPINQTRKAAASVMALLLIAGGAIFSALPAHAETSAQLCAAAPVFQILMDVSGSSPLRSPEYIQAVAPLLESKIRALPICSEVLIVTIGDASLYPVMIRKKLFLRTANGGATKDDLIRGLRQLLAGMPKRIADNPHSKSELIGAFADAARNLNPQAKTPNQIMALSDGIENGPLANCDRNPHCRFPAPGFRLSGVSVALLGCGLGLPSDRAQWILKQWELFFTAAGVKAYLPRTF